MNGLTVEDRVAVESDEDVGRISGEDFHLRVALASVHSAGPRGFDAMRLGTVSEPVAD